MSAKVNRSQVAALAKKAALVVLGVLGFVLTIVRIPLFLVLFWLRLPVMFVCNVLSIPMLFCFIFSWYAFPDKTQMVVSFGVVSFVAFVLMWLYDILLMWLSPTDMVTTL